MLQTHPLFFHRSTLRDTQSFNKINNIFWWYAFVVFATRSVVSPAKPSQAKSRQVNLQVKEVERVEMKKKIEPWATTKTTFSSFENNNFIKNLFLLWNSYKFILLDTFWGFIAFFVCINMSVFFVLKTLSLLRNGTVLFFSVHYSLSSSHFHIVCNTTQPTKKNV